MPIKTRTGGRHLDFVAGVGHGVVILATNVDGTGRKTVLAIDSIESFTTGAGGLTATDAPNWKQGSSA